MDRPRSPVQDAGRWVRSIPPLWCLLVDKHEEWGRLPADGRDGPARWRLFDCQWRLTQPPGYSPRRASGRGLGLLLPVHRLLQPARYGWELRMFVVAVFHLLNVVVVVVADVPPVAGVVAAGDESNASHWPATLSDPPGSPPFHHLSASARASMCRTHYSHGPARQLKRRNSGELAQDSPLPGSGAAMVKT